MVLSSNESGWAPPTWSSVPLAAPTQNLWLKHFICRGKRQGERVSGGTVGAAVQSNNDQAYLTIILLTHNDQSFQHQNGYLINIPCNVSVGKWNGKERVSGTVGAASKKESNNNQAYLTIILIIHNDQSLQHQNGFLINIPCNIPVGKWNGMKRVSGCGYSSSQQGNKTTTYHAGPSSIQIQCLEQQSSHKSVWEGWGRIERQG
jgi:hypothetical protein